MTRRGRNQARAWGSRVATWHDHVGSSAGFDKVLSALIDTAELKPMDRAVDLGAGTGFLSTAIADHVSVVLAVDIAPEMLAELRQRTRAANQSNVITQVADLATFDLPAGSVDLVVSNYALHHLEHAEKRALVAKIYRWLAPGGRVVIADMMFGRGTTAHDRAVLVVKARRLVRKGPGGLWRVVKNVTRFGLGVGTERPAPPEFWLQAFRDAGLRDAVYVSVVEEAGMVHATAPPRTNA